MRAGGSDSSPRPAVSITQVPTPNHWSASCPACQVAGSQTSLRQAWRLADSTSAFKYVRHDEPTEHTSLISYDGLCSAAEWDRTAAMPMPDATAAHRLDDAQGATDQVPNSVGQRFWATSGVS